MQLTFGSFWPHLTAAGAANSKPGDRGHSLLVLQFDDRLACGHLLGGRGQDRNFFFWQGQAVANQAEGPYPFLVESVFDSDLMTPAHEMATGCYWIFHPCQSAMSLGKGALAQVPQEHCSLD
jgi:hypothetical protein